MNIKVAIFDMDGTLVDSLMTWDVLWADLGEKFLNDSSFLPTREDDKRVRTLALKDSMDLIHKTYRLGESGEELLTEANRMLNDFYAKRVEMKKGAENFWSTAEKTA